jgi:carbon-monoxide dehydrogenase small subunit
MLLSFTLNGKEESLDIDPSLRLLQLIRNTFGLLGTKKGCLQGQCGYCHVFLNNEIVPSCLIPVFSVQGGSILTLEGLRGTPEYYDIEKGFIDAGFTPCGFCASAKVLLTHALLNETLHPSELLIRNRFAAILCRCTDSTTLVRAVQKAASIRRHRQHAL